ncbi:MAG: hypothetical protein K1X53_02160 [Candidatus Sumerlaeaceae bacterium]|nr:hypothetical protein [Candidatus Sumerlaeaceae bacterium]
MRARIGGRLETLKRLVNLIKSAFPSREEWRTNRIAFLLCVLSGLFGALVFPRFSLAELAWIALVPFFVAVHSLRGRCLFWGVYLFGFPWFYLSLWWLNTLTAFNDFIPLGIIFLGFMQGTYFLWFAYPAGYVMRRLPPWLAPFVVAFLWTGMEHIRNFSDLAFPWNNLAHTQAVPRFLTLIQIADLGGTGLISFLVALGNAVLAQIVIELRARATGRNSRVLLALTGLIGAVAVLTFVNIYGVVRMGQYTSQEVPNSLMLRWPKLKVSVIQPNISQLEKWNAYSPGNTDDQRLAIEANMARTVFSAVRATREAAPQLVVLPEAVFISPFFIYDTMLHGALAGLSREVGADLLFGADNREPFENYLKRMRAGFRTLGPADQSTSRALTRIILQANDRGETHPMEASENMAAFASAWQVKPETGLQPYVYDKVQLVPFGETAPVVDMIPYFQEKIMMVGSFQRGLEQTVFETSGTRYGVMICFESSFGHLAGGLARAGAQFLCVITNDAWYDPSYQINNPGSIWGALFRVPFIHGLSAAGPYQHLSQSVFRAIETRLPVVRSANTGISAIVGPDGVILDQAPFDEFAMLHRELRVAPPNPSLTLYSRFGNWFSGSCLAMLAVVLVFQIRDFRRRT